MAPILNDVATDLQNPPEFSSSALNPLPEKFKAKVSNAYQTQLQALELQATKEQAFQACVKAAKEQPRWELTQEDPSKSQVEGIASTKVLKFKDDFVIRVTDTAESKVRVDMRSKSRMGKGDWGTNAKRIETYMKYLSEHSGFESKWLPLADVKKSGAA